MFQKVLISFIILSIISGCNSVDDLTTNTISTDFNSKSDKIEFMKIYYTPEFDFVNVDYHIIYHDNSADRSIPGPSDAEMIFLFKLDEKKLNTFLGQRLVVESFSMNSQIEFLKSINKWDKTDDFVFLDNEDIIIKNRNSLIREVLIN